MPFTIVVVTPLITTADYHHGRPSGIFEQNRSSGGNDGRRCG